MLNEREFVKLKGCVEFDLFDKEGKLLSHQKCDNLIVTVGKSQIAGLINGSVTTPFKYIAIGGSTTAEAAGQTALVAEFSTFGGQRTLGSTDRITTVVANDTMRVVASFTFPSGGVPGAFVNEAGLFDAVSAGNMCSRKVPTPVAIAVSTTLQVTWTIQVS